MLKIAEAKKYPILIFWIHLSTYSIIPEIHTSFLLYHFPKSNFPMLLREQSMLIIVITISIYFTPPLVVKKKCEIFGRKKVLFYFTVEALKLTEWMSMSNFSPNDEYFLKTSLNQKSLVKCKVIFQPLNSNLLPKYKKLIGKEKYECSWTDWTYLQNNFLPPWRDLVISNLHSTLIIQSPDPAEMPTKQTWDSGLSIWRSRFQ